ncbi:hypothetical protein EYB53_013360 [Candidatus Chloroploca sp. M-50]|uniref:Uncharacterized protein n=1 Tax=Candidatus Chloroploca mongolica TaxID=2528176 RepID=A0ABS4DB80_9CHLR|nr:hypothetical protein [Candidatus Chloroploca mongolica]MBP1466698.1 hypothetical protein [Candidatus Chloroploca mongolica]
MMRLQTDHPTRAEHAAYLAEALAGLYEGPAEPAATPGGRRAALRRLSSFDPRDYARTRNDVVRRGVSLLSPYLRHGILGLAEVRDFLVTRFAPGPGLAKFVNELAWRAFWQLVYAEKGEGVHEDLEPAKVSLRRERGVPADVEQAATGLVCLDTALRELYKVVVYQPQPLVHWRGAAPRRFSAFWRRVETEAMRPTGSGPQAYTEQSS